MELILWRHAEAKNGTPDIERRLTDNGLQQAKQVAKWLKARLPDDALIIASSAQRTQQTAVALGRSFLTDERIGLNATVKGLLAAADWPNATKTVVIVGHQPTLGEVGSLLVSNDPMALSFQTGELKWFNSTVIHGETTSFLRHDIYPEMLR